MRPLALLLPALILLAACGEDTTVTRVIGLSGGELTVGGATIRFPANAVLADTEITVSVSEASAPAGFVALSKVFECGPSGLDFPVAVVMQMPFVADGKAATMMWSSGSDPSFKDVGGTVSGDIMRAEVRHFSSGFVGRVAE